MGFLSRVIFAVLVIGVGLGIRELTKTVNPPTLDVDQYWGPGKKENYKKNTEVITDKIFYSDKVIETLRKDLNRSFEFQPPLEGVGFEYGFNSNYLKDLIKYWRDEYLPKWRSRVDYLMKWPHFTTNIQGLNIHYLHIKPTEGKKVFPLLLLHGWPGSIREFYDFIPFLVDNKNSEYAFEVVIPCLPGYGWSEAVAKPGMGPAAMAVVLRNLMIRLGYNKFFIQGGDWGSIVGSNVATLFPDNVLGYHSNMCVSSGPISYVKAFIASFIPSLFVPEGYEDLFFPLSQKFATMLEESGYFHIQATKPDTIGTVLASHNPVGLAAYILEKFSTGTNLKYRKRSDGGLVEKHDMDALLDNVMIYYLTNSMTSAQRLYAEAMTIRERSYNLHRVSSKVPTGCARFRHDGFHTIDWVLKDKYLNFIHSTYHQNGGHFIAMELPKVLYDDFIQFIEKVVKLRDL